MESQGHGNYVHLDVDLPPLFLVYLPNPSDSGKIHSDVAARWERGGIVGNYFLFYYYYDIIYWLLKRGIYFSVLNHIKVTKNSEQIGHLHDN